ncbi:MAG: nucleotidyltransferase domain-containing protein [Solirubrobacteraceae bacterium]
MVSEDAIQGAAQRLAAEAGRGARVFLFGSHARGEAGPHSDIDFLVIEPHVDRRHAEMVRLRRALRGLDASVDVIVYSEEQADRFGRTWGHVVRHALEEGQLLAAS